ncbi:DUF58 domain-containing protein [Ilumatobacter nonamiensis]|uniref:DUF58 domain-containing protein n=1 Tax=Ilumatobacter nonamiensis TaxID=467093 RepID=UPI0003475546|nr:DUF58 domain-containing protein [Ilumatobacter nonamiensis]
MPTGWAALVIVLPALAFAIIRPTDWWVVALVLGAIVLLAVGDFFAAPHPRGIEVVREFPASLTLGERGELGWLVQNRAGRAVRVSVADALWPSLQASRRFSEFALAADRQHRFGATIEPLRRGRFPFGAVTIRTLGPLRMVRRQQTRTVSGSLAVLPAYPSRDAMLTRMRIPLETGIRSVRTRGTGTDFDQLREYRPGDDIRRVDWAATARQPKAIVREYRAERNQHVVALLDNGRVMAGTVGGAPRVEHAMDAVLGLTQVATRIGDNIGLLTFDNQVRGIVPASNGKAQFGRVTEAMYLLDTQYDESAYRTAFTTAAARFRRRSLFVVFTDLVESIVVDSLLPALPTLTRTHLVLIAAVRDPDVSDWASATRHDGVDESFRSAAAVASLNSRERAIAKLSATGAIVVDSRPGDLATDVVDRYLELKARGRL